MERQLSPTCFFYKHSDDELTPARKQDRTWLFLLCALEFWSQFKPSEPFLVDFFVNEKGLSNRDVFQHVFVLFVYARLPFVALVGLFSELPCCGNRCILVFGALCGMATDLLTRFGDTLLHQQIAQFTVAAAFASRITVPAVIFKIALSSQFQQSVCMLKAVLLLSNFCSAVLGQILKDVVGLPVTRLVEISAAGSGMSVLCALLFAVLGRDPDSDDDEVQDAHPVPVIPTPSLTGLRQPLVDLWLSLKLRSVFWWTVWAVSVSPVHGLAMSNWQSLVRAKHVKHDLNGYLLAAMYLISAIVTLATGYYAPLRKLTSSLVIGTMLAAGVILCRLVSESQLLPMYGYLLLYQCMFEVACALRTFQIGAEVTRAAAASTSKALHQKGTIQLPSCARLTLLFSATGVLVHTIEVLIQVAISHWSSIEDRFRGFGRILTVFALFLLLIRFSEACIKKALARVLGQPTET